MRYRPGPSRSALRLTWFIALLTLCVVAIGCGSSGSGGETARQEQEAARDAREARESRRVELELKNGDFVRCGGKVFASAESLCTYARNVQNAYYTEVIAGRGETIGFQPPAKQDYAVICSGTVPHRCTGFKEDGVGIETLPSGTIFFSP